MNHKKPFFRRNMHKRPFFLPYFSNQICKQTIVCFILHRLSFKKIIIYCTKEQDNLVNLRIWSKFGSRCKSYYIFFSESGNFWRTLYINLPICQLCSAFSFQIGTFLPDTYYTKKLHNNRILSQFKIIVLHIINLRSCVKQWAISSKMFSGIL